MAGPVVTYYTPLPPATHRDEYQWPRPQRKSCSAAKRVERRLIRAWKRLTGTMRHEERASILPDGFVLLNAAAARRRSMRIPSA